MDGRAANEMVAEILMDKVRSDTYPSVTQMNMLEEMLQPEQMPEYVEILLEKVAEDPYPSITMLRRIQRLAG